MENHTNGDLDLGSITNMSALEAPLSRRTVLRAAGGMAALGTAAFLGACSLTGGASSGSNQVTISFQHHESQYLEALLAVVAAFEKANPNIKVQANASPWTSAFSLLTNQSQTKTLPDVFIVGDTWVAPFAQIGALADLTPRVAKSSIDFDTQVYPGDKLFYHLDNKWYGAPFSAETRLLFYRKDWLEQAGLHVPTTHDEFVNVAKTLTDPGKGQFGYGFIGNPDGVTFQTFCTWAIQRGASLFKKTSSGALASNITSNEFIAALQWYTDLVLKEKVTPTGAAGNSQTDVTSGFQGGSIAMVIDNQGFIPALNKTTTLAGKWGVAKLPKGPANDYTFLGGIPLVMSSASKNPEAAWKFIEYMTTFENVSPYLVASDSLPAYKDVAEDFLKVAQDPELLNLFVNGLPNAVPNSYPFPAPPVLATMTDGQMPLQYAIQDILTGKSTVAQAASAADQKVNDLLKKQ